MRQDKNQRARGGETVQTPVIKNPPPSSAFTLDTAIYAPVCSTLTYITHTRLPVRNTPTTLGHTQQSCLLHKEARDHFWPQGAVLQEKLWGSQVQVETTVVSSSPPTSRSEVLLSETLNKMFVCVGCLSSQQQASVSQDGSAQTILRAATLR